MREILLALAHALVGPGDPGALERHVDAIVAAVDGDETMGRVLVVVARHETYYRDHQHGGTPPFGLTDREVRLGLPRESVERSAEIARDVLRHHLAMCGSWAAALGRYHHGTRGEHHGCWVDALARREACEARVGPCVSREGGR